MHQPINERVTNLVATRQETTLEHQPAPTALLNNLSFSPLVKEEGLVAEEKNANNRGVQEQEAASSLERGEIMERGEVSPKVEAASDGAPLACRTCNKVGGENGLMIKSWHFHSASSLKSKQIGGFRNRSGRVCSVR